MKITDVHGFAVKFERGDFFGGKGSPAEIAPASAYSKQPGWRGLYSSKTETCLVKICTDSDIVGYGEAQAPIAPEVTANIVNRLLKPLLVGENPLAGEVLRHEMYQSMNLRGHFTGFMLDAISGADSALWDIRGKHFNASVCALMGGPFRTRVPVYVSGIRGETVKEKIATIERFMREGFRAFKVFTGFGIEADLAMVRELRSAIGKEGTLAVDNLWKYDINDAIHLGRRYQEMDIAWYEAPTDPEDIDGNAELARTLDMPIANGETERTCSQTLPWIQKRAVDLVQPDIGRCGITEGRKIVALAELFHLPSTLHMGMSSAALIAASIQVAAAAPNVRYIEYQPVMLELANSILDTPLECTEGHFTLPSRPGLGIDVSEDNLRRHIAA